MNIGNILTTRKGQTPKGTHYEIIITDLDNKATPGLYERGVYVKIGDRTSNAVFTSVENVKWQQSGEWALKTSSGHITGDIGQLALRLTDGVIALNDDEAAWVREESKRPVRRFISEKDLETGITYYQLLGRVAPEEWRKIAHLFERDIEIDCPESGIWNDSVTLKWATREPEKVAEILGWKIE